MNKYTLIEDIHIEEKLSSTVFAVAAIENKQVIELRYLEDFLGSEYFRITHGLESFSEEVLDKLCFHSGTKAVCLELSNMLSESFSENGEVCFGKLEDGVFLEL